jgi:hypothetical protein
LCAAEKARPDSKAYFFGVERIASFFVKAGCDVNWEVWNLGGFKMAFRPFITRLSVVTAYIAFAFVGAIVLGVF